MVGHNIHKVIILFILLCIMSMTLLLVGKVDISFIQLIESAKTFLYQENYSIIDNIIINIRLPKMIAALLSGGALAICGLMMQVYFSNPLAGPFVLGIHSGASLFVALYVMIGHVIKDVLPLYIFNSGLVLFSIIGSGASLAFLLLINLKTKAKVILLIVGLLMSHISSGIINFLIVFSPSSKIKNYLLWTQGSFSSLSYEEIPILVSVVFMCVLIVFKLSKELNLLMMGENYAQSMGVNTVGLKWKLIILTGILSGVITAFCGPISFVGILAPHLSRMYFQTNNHRFLLPATFLLGSLLTLLVAFLVEVNTFVSLPINSVFGLFGAPFIIYLILKRSKYE